VFAATGYECQNWDTRERSKHEKQLIEMNEARRRASGRVQRAMAKVALRIDEPGHPTGHSRSSLKEETTMLKTISAALLAVSVIAAPALAASSDKTAPAPAAKSTQVKSTQVKTSQVKPSALNAKAKMHHQVRHVRHHRSHAKMSTLKTHKASKLAIKPAAPAAKRG
jgi:hypothetical protein